MWEGQKIRTIVFVVATRVLPDLLYLYRTYYRLNSKRSTYNIPYYTLYTKHGSLDTLLRRPPIWAYDGRFGRVGPPAYGARTVGAGRRGGWPRAGRETAARPQTCTSRSVSWRAGWRAPRAADASTQNRGADSVFPILYITTVGANSNDQVRKAVEH